LSARTKARKEALDLLFEVDLRNKSIATEVSQGATSNARDYAKEILQGISINQSRIDELIRSYIQGWDFDRIPNVDRNILRIAIWELLWGGLPEAIVIDEALKLATELSTENSPTFIHGVLSKIATIKNQIAL
jgi:transcription antitermination protein NusB